MSKAVEDKENYHGATMVRADGKAAAAFKSPDASSEAKPSRRAGGGGGMFGRLLGEVTNQMKSECDEKVAVKLQDQDANSLMNEWLQEVRDKQMAAQLGAQLEAQAKDEAKKAEVDGEAAAMQLAVEERRRVAAEAQAKREREEKDSHMAKNVYDEEKHVHELCERDDALAQELHDAQVAEALQQAEDRRAEAARKKLDAVARADAALAQAAQEELESQARAEAAKQEEADLAVARRLLEEEGKAAMRLREDQERQEAEDAKQAKKLQQAAMRAEHRRLKYIQLVVNAPYASGVNVPTPSELWRDADPVIEDVAGGICITILLPHVKGVDVRLCRKNVVVVEATRAVGPDEEAAATEAGKAPQHTTFDIDFEIEGHPVKLTQQDLHYEYASDNGMLHVYVDHVHLEQEGAAAASAATSTKGVGGVIRNVMSRIFSSRHRSSSSAREPLEGELCDSKA